MPCRKVEFGMQRAGWEWGSRVGAQILSLPSMDFVSRDLREACKELYLENLNINQHSPGTRRK